MWIVRLALRRPYTVAVMALLILLMGILSLTRMQTDIFPIIDIPVVAVVWSYPGLSAEDMERRVVLISERAYSTTVNGIERIESQSIPGVGLLRVYFQPGADIGSAISQLSSVSSTLLRITPPGMTPPNIIQFNASNVPVAQLTISSPTLPEQALTDYALNFVRIRLFTIPGLSTPAPFGGKLRTVIVDVDPAALASKGLSPGDVVTALQQSNVILPAGSSRMGETEYNILVNSSPTTLDGLAAIPIKVVNGQPVQIRDVARVSDTFVQQTNIVRVNGRRATWLAILKHANASTLAVVDATREALPAIQAAAPQGMEFRIDFDQSVFVRGAIKSVVREAVIAAILVSLMVLAFLGSWRSVVMVSTSIPLAILTAIVGLFLLGQTINVMTLGGLALAIGMLVDDATVEVENIHRNHAMGKPLTVAILDGARQVATPAIVATLAICIVFFPVVFLYGPAKFLFTPLALSVVLSMLASYVLSRTLVPSLARKIMEDREKPPGRLNRLRVRALDRLQHHYGNALDRVMAHRAVALVAATLLIGITIILALFIGTDFYPRVDAGQMRLHVRARVGLRIEETEKVVAEVERAVREIIGDELSAINDMIGVPVYYNLAFVPTDNTSGMDAEMRIGLGPRHRPTEIWQRRLREELPARFPGVEFYFMPADIVTQVLSFGVPAPIDVQIEGADLARSFALARRLQGEIALVPGAVDVHVRQVLDYPALRVEVDRLRAAQVGLTELNVSNSLLVALTGSGTVSPSYFLNPQNNVNYTVAVRVPPSLIESVPQLAAVPLVPPAPINTRTNPLLPNPMAVPRAPAQTLGNIATISPDATPTQIDHYTVQRVIDVAASVDGRDLGSVARDIRARIDALGPLPPGQRVTLRGQYEVMRDSFTSMGGGLVLAIILVYFLMVILFQSWIDPLLIMGAVPGALVGILWMLAATRTTLNVQSLMGAIMAVGIAVSNSILLVSFANDRRAGEDPGAHAAIIEAARTRLRPVIMTALAMIIGMLPMALGLGEAGEQNAPLGRAVIGGLLVATVMTLLIVPVLYSLLRKTAPRRHLLDEQFQREAAGEPPANR